MTATSNNIITFRRHDLDNLRTCLTGLVIVGHTAIVYGSGGEWPVRSAAVPPGTSPPLMAFGGFNQTFFMALFFWVSGRVSAQSMQRCLGSGQGKKNDDRSKDKGKGGISAFIAAKLRRLAVPTAIYSLAIFPLAHLLVLPRWDFPALTHSLTADLLSLRGARGPVWYAATLLALDLGAAALTAGAGAVPAVADRTYDALARWGWLGVVALSFGARARWAIDDPARVPVLNVRAGFLPQYVYAYVLGWLSLARGEERMKSPWEAPAPRGGAAAEEGKGKRKRKELKEGGEAGRGGWGPLSMTGATLVSQAAMLLAFLPVLLRVNPATLKEDLGAYMGGWNSSALCYALWNEFSFVCVGPALMALFQRRYNAPATSRLFEPRYSYAAFLVHTPVNVAFEVAVEAVLCSGGERAAWMSSVAWKALGPVVMSVLVGAVNVVASFVVGRWLVDYVPGVASFI